MSKTFDFLTNYRRIIFVSGLTSGTISYVMLTASLKYYDGGFDQRMSAWTANQEMVKKNNIDKKFELAMLDTKLDHTIAKMDKVFSNAWGQSAYAEQALNQYELKQQQ